MNIIGNIANTTKGMVSGVGKMLIPAKQPKKQIFPDHYHQTPEEYAKYLTSRKTRKY